LDQEALRHATEHLLSVMTENGSLLFQPRPRRKPTFSKGEIAAFMRELTEGSVIAEDGRLHRPYPVPDVVPRNNYVGSMYSDESLRTLTEQVYANALVIYQDLVATWFPAFVPLLGLACIMPVLFTGRLMPRGDSLSGPDFVYHIEPLPPTELTRAEVRLATTREELFGHDRSDITWIMEEGVRLRRLITAFHPGVEGWAHIRSVNTDPDVWGDRPATTQACRWLREDLEKLHMVKQGWQINDD
jgi:hypothetical protein